MRAKYVARHFDCTVVKCRLYDAETDALYDSEIVLPDTYNDEKAFAKAINAYNATSSTNVVKVLSATTLRKFYRQPVEQFIANAELVNEEDVDPADMAE